MRRGPRPTALVSPSALAAGAVGTLRLRVVSALGPLAQDVVVTGHERDEIGVLVFPSAAAAALPADELAARIRAGLAALRAEGGSSQAPARALVPAEPLSPAAGEITDKGYVNQRTVLARRAADVFALHSQPRDARVVAF